MYVYVMIAWLLMYQSSGVSDNELGQSLFIIRADAPHDLLHALGGELLGI